MKYFVAHYHEIGLKGKNRSFFEKRLIQNIKFQLADFPLTGVRAMEGRILISWQGEKEIEQGMIKKLSQVFGLVSFSPVELVQVNLPAIIQAAVDLARSLIIQGDCALRFAVRAKRADKRFSQTSEEVNRLVGRAILDQIGGRVDLRQPEIIFSIEILSRLALLGTEKYPGPGGLPVGVSGRVVALLSGGIDSPVAAWKIMKRGAEVIFVHFHSYPHTSRASMEKVRELARILGNYQPFSKLFFVPLAEAQREIVRRTAPRYRVILYRRLMFRLAMKIACQEKAQALVTGESLGQVASQTMSNLTTIEQASSLPVFRPLIGEDKEEIISLAKKINTFEISILPYDDCCTLFVPKNPALESRSIDLEAEEAHLDFSGLIEEMSKQLEIISLK